jgi:bacterioferritin-associated ferredoxin
MYVCSCRAVTDRTVKAAIASGATTIDAIAERCGAGGRCGGCWPALAELLEDARPADHQHGTRATSAA